MTRTAVSSDQAPEALGPYSQAIVAGGFVFCSGMAGMTPLPGRSQRESKPRPSRRWSISLPYPPPRERRSTTWSRRRSSTPTSRTSGASMRSTHATCPIRRRPGQPRHTCGCPTGCSSRSKRSPCSRPVSPRRFLRYPWHLTAIGRAQRVPDGLPPQEGRTSTCRSLTGVPWRTELGISAIAATWATSS